MKKQEIIQLLVLENYSGQTSEGYSSALKLFPEIVEKLAIDKISENEIQNYLYYCKKYKNK